MGMQFLGYYRGSLTHRKQKCAEAFLPERVLCSLIFPITSNGYPLVSAALPAVESPR